MKSFLFFIIAVILSGSSCKKHKPISPVNQLPPKTQTGANTFGCLVNGEVFKPGGLQLAGGSLNCVYQYVSWTNPPGGYIFVLSAGKRHSDGSVESVAIEFDSVTLNPGIYHLVRKAKGKGGGGYSNINYPQAAIFETNDEVVGQLNLNRFDTIYQIASGTFWFNAINEQGDTVKVTDGRFDVHFTR